jgi:hypothetical protein
MGRTLLKVLITFDAVKPIPRGFNGFFDLRQPRFGGLQGHDMCRCRHFHRVGRDPGRLRRPFNLRGILGAIHAGDAVTEGSGICYRTFCIGHDRSSPVKVNQRTIYQ